METFKIMEKTYHFFRILTIVLLIFVGGSAVYGGWSLITDPTGQNLGLPLELLNNTPFKHYFVPGLLLFIVIGVDSLALAVFVYYKYPIAPPLMMVQGVVLVGWLTVEVFMGLYFNILHIPLYIIALLLIGLGYWFNKVTFE